MKTFKEEIFDEYLKYEYQPIGIILKDERTYENHIQEIRQQLIAENQCENTIYVVE